MIHLIVTLAVATMVASLAAAPTGSTASNIPEIWPDTIHLLPPKVLDMLVNQKFKDARGQLKACGDDNGVYWDKRVTDVKIDYKGQFDWTQVTAFLRCDRKQTFGHALNLYMMFVDYTIFTKFVNLLENHADKHILEFDRFGTMSQYIPVFVPSVLPGEPGNTKCEKVYNLVKTPAAGQLAQQAERNIRRVVIHVLAYSLSCRS